MNKIKITVLITIMCVMSVNFPALSAQTVKIKPNPKIYKNALENNKAKYINKDWWSKFKDPVLDGYIMKAAASNHDLKIATLKVLETQALVRQSLGKEFPVITLGGDYLRQKTSGNVSMGTFPGSAYTKNTFTFPLSANYELDLWRKNRDATIQKAKELEAVRYDEKSAYISLTSLVAGVYFNVISLDKQIELQKEIVSLSKKSFELAKEKFNHGLISSMDTIQAEQAYLQANSNLSELEKQRTVFLNLLAVLTGESSDSSSSLKRSSIDDIALLKDLPESIKSNMVLNRPDILKSEALLQKARIDVKLARKDFLPDINIFGKFGFNANELSKVFNWDSYIASVGGSVLETIFSGGQRLAWLKAKKYSYEQMIESYQKTILQSFQEVNDSFASLKYDTSKYNDELTALELEKTNMELVNARYEKGLISYFDTLQFGQNLALNKMRQTQAKTDCLVDTLSLYKALGGNL